MSSRTPTQEHPGDGFRLSRREVSLLLPLLLLGCQPGVIDFPEPSPEPASFNDDPVIDTVVPETSVEIVPDQTWEHPGILLVDTLGQSIVTETKIDAWMEEIRWHDGTGSHLDHSPRTWEGHVGIEVHGSSSASFSKRNYRIELRDDNGDDLDYALLGLPEEADWVLHGPYSDKSLIRNAIAYGLGRAISTGQWQPRTAFAELLINRAHQGVYLVVERVERGGERVDISAISDDEPGGGYIVKIDQNRGPGWRTDMGTPIDYHYPKSEEITATQDLWIKTWFDNMEAMMADDDFTQRWPDRLDGDSFIDHYIINELSKNVDGYRLSGYLHLDATESGSGKLVAGPLWDFNLAFGNVDYCYCWEVEGAVYDALDQCGSGDQEPFWWQRLLEDPAYVDALRCRWEELRVGALSDQALQDMIAQYTTEIADIADRNDEAWGVLGSYVWPNFYVGQTWQEELVYLDNWLLSRAAWLDDNLPGTCGS